MNINEALAKVSESNPDEVNIINNFISDMKSKNVVTLAENEAFTLTNKEGDIKAFKQNINLSAYNKTLIQPLGYGPYVISAQGYEYVAEKMGICVIFPDTVSVGHTQVPNPYAERDSKDNRIIAVHSRAVAFMYSEKGIPVVSDWSTVFDTMQYRLIDLLAKAKKFPQAFRLLPNGMAPKEDGTWAKYTFDSSSDLFINTSHNEALTWFSQIINREKKSMDFSQTFAKRNAIKHLTGLQSVPGQTDSNGKTIPIDNWNITTICWRPTNNSALRWDTAQYKQLRANVGGIIAGKTETFGDKRIEMKSGTEHVEPDEDTNSIDPEDQEKVIDIKQTKADPEPTKYTDEEQKIMNNLDSAKNSLPDQFKQALEELKCIESPDPNQAKKILKKINEIVDKEIQ